MLLNVPYHEQDVICVNIAMLGLHGGACNIDSCALNMLKDYSKLSKICYETFHATLHWAVFPLLSMTDTMVRAQQGREAASCVSSNEHDKDKLKTKSNSLTFNNGKQITLHSLRAGVSCPERGGPTAHNLVNLIDENNPALSARKIYHLGAASCYQGRQP